MCEIIFEFCKVGKECASITSTTTCSRCRRRGIPRRSSAHSSSRRPRSPSLKWRHHHPSIEKCTAILQKRSVGWMHNYYRTKAVSKLLEVASNAGGMQAPQVKAEPQGSATAPAPTAAAAAPVSITQDLAESLVNGCMRRGSVEQNSNGRLRADVRACAPVPAGRQAGCQAGPRARC